MRRPPPPVWRISYPVSRLTQLEMGPPREEIADQNMHQICKMSARDAGAVYGTCLGAARLSADAVCSKDCGSSLAATRLGVELALTPPVSTRGLLLLPVHEVVEGCCSNDGRMYLNVRPFCLAVALT